MRVLITAICLSLLSACCAPEPGDSTSIRDYYHGCMEAHKYGSKPYVRPSSGVR